MNIFERGSLLYCNMSFDALLSVRKQLEEFGFPCKAVNDGLWLQVINLLPDFSIFSVPTKTLSYTLVVC